MVKIDKLIKVPPKLALFFISFVVIVFITMIWLSLRQARNYKAAGYETRIDSTFITGNENYGGGIRGAVFYKKNWFVNSAATLVENASGFTKWSSGGPFIDFDSVPYTYTLSDLGLPYSIFKKENNDTIVVTKNGYILKFLFEK